ncbi:MAG: hypothetical protein ACM3QW_00140 [Ignavibacteriales bacterium]
MVYSLVLVLLVVLIATVPDLIKKQMWREICIFGVLFTLAAIYSIGQIYGWPLPNPTRHFEYQFVPVAKMMEKLFP